MKELLRETVSLPLNGNLDGGSSGVGSLKSPRLASSKVIKDAITLWMPSYNILSILFIEALRLWDIFNIICLNEK